MTNSLLRLALAAIVAIVAAGAAPFLGVATAVTRRTSMARGLPGLGKLSAAVDPNRRC